MADRRRRTVAAMGLVVAGFGIAGGLLAWRLARGPIELPMLRSYLIRTLSPADGSATVEIGTTALAWNGRRRGTELRLRGVRIVGVSGETLLAVPEAALRFRTRSLLRGIVAPTEVALRGLELLLVRHGDGRLDVGAGIAATEQGGASARRLAMGSSEGVLAALRIIRLEHAAMTIVDEAHGEESRLRVTDLELRRDSRGIGGRFTGEVVLGTATVPLRGRARLHLDEALGLAHASLHLRGGPGTLPWPEVPAGALAAEHVRLVATLDGPADTAALRAVLHAPDGPVLRLRAHVAGLQGPSDVRATARVTDLATDALGGWWPTTAAPGVRDWVTSNVRGGRVREAWVRARAATTADPRTVALESATGTLTYDGLTVAFLAPAPPATGVTGHARFAMRPAPQVTSSAESPPARWSFTVARAAVADLTITGADVEIVDTGTRSPSLTVDVAANGSVAEALRVFETLSSGAIDRGTLDPSTVEGTAAGRVQVRLALDRPPSVVDVSVSGEATDVAIPGAFRGRSFDYGRLDFALQRSGIRVSATGRLAGIPLDLDWRRDTTGDGRVAQRFTAHALVDDPGRAALGLDLGSAMTGVGEVRAEAAIDAQGDGWIDVETDLRQAALDLALLNAKKPPGTPAQARARVLLADGRATAVEGIELRVDPALMRGRATLAPSGEWRAIDAEATIAPAAPDGAPAHVTLTVRPRRPGSASALAVRSTDAGAFFRAIGSLNDAVGGQLTYEGTIDVNDPTLPFDGQLAVRGFTLSRSPLLMRLATLASVSGITSALAGNGIAVDVLKAGVAHRAGTVTITDGLLSGPSLRVLAAGTIDRDAHTLALQGTFAPSYYGLNALPKHLPVLGKLLTGGRERAVVAFDFDVRGTLAEPDVSLRPMSALTPGALRELLRRDVP